MVNVICVFRNQNTDMCLRLLSTTVFAACGFALIASSTNAGIPRWAVGPEPELSDEYAVKEARNPKNRVGVQGTVSFGIDAKFMSEAFTGNDIVTVPANGPQDVIVDPGSAGDDEEDALGGELFFERVLGESDLLDSGVNETWGLRVGVGFTQLEFSSNSNLDTFEQVAPGLQSPFLSQGSMNHDFEADLWYLNLGLFSESHITDRFRAKFGVGISAAYIDASYTVSGPFDFATAQEDDQDLLVGGYVDLTFGFDFTRSLALDAGLRYQYFRSFDMVTGFSEASIDFDQSFMAFIGLRYSF